jgi:micrococcal nuclease
LKQPNQARSRSGKPNWLTLFAAAVIALALLAAGYFIGKSQSSSPSANPGTFEKAFVKRVVDGDTIELADGRIIRYIGVNTPEIATKEKPAECYGPEASQRNRELVGGKEIELMPGIEELDKYGRHLSYVFSDGVFVNAELIEEGFGHAFLYSGGNRFDQVFVQLENYARLRSLGLWAACPGK